MSLAKLQEPTDKGLILLTGIPGAGKSTFCYQTVLKSIAADLPVIFVTSERNPAEVRELLSERGMGEAADLNFVDAFTQTVGLPGMQRADTEDANCADLNTLSIAITKLKERTGSKRAVLVFDSLTSPYLLNGVEVVKFMRLFLSKFASEGNSVLALVDEGCGKEEDLGAMMSMADGIIRMELVENSRTLNVVKHPSVRPVKFEVPIVPEHAGVSQQEMTFNKDTLGKWGRAMLNRGDAGLRSGLGDYVNLFWANLAHWSGMLWDPKRFPITTYELNKEDPRSMSRENWSIWPWYARIFMKLYLPRNYQSVKVMKKAAKRGAPYIRTARWERSGIIEYQSY